MRTVFQSKPDDGARFLVPISEFSYSKYSVQIKRDSRRFPDTTSSQIKPCMPWLCRKFQALAGAIRQCARGASFQTGCVTGLRLFENGSLNSAWTARALAARVFIGIKHPESSWLTDRLPVALWPEALKREIQQNGFTKPADLEVCTN